MRRTSNLVAVLAGFALINCSFAQTQRSGAERTARYWPTLARECKPGVIWWVPGSAMTKSDITYNLEQLHDAGFGGMSMVPIYGVRGFEDRFLEHLSPRWNEHYQFVVAEANRLGLWLDLTPGTGWKIGGPTVTPEMGEHSVRLIDGQLVARPNRSRVKRAAPGGAGLSIDPYNAQALAQFLHEFGSRLEISNERIPRAFYHDSFEYNGNWTQRLPAVFEQQHGYDLLDHGDSLFGRSADQDRNGRVQCDYRETLASLHYAFVEQLRAWAHDHGSQLREQAHGSPGNILDLYALADIPETEVFGTNRFNIRGLRHEADFVRHENDSAPLVNRMASSAAHIAGGKLVSSESFTWLREHFNTSLADIKPEIDSLFVAGVNHLFYHGNCFSPREAEWPGWLFYASTEVNPRNAIWRDIPVLNAYIARCQSVLQTGEIDNDVLLYWPIYDVYQHVERGPQVFLRVHNHEHWLTQTECGKLALRLSQSGVMFDFVSDRYLQQIRCEDGKITLGKSSYEAVIVPPCQFMPLATLKRLMELSHEGVPVCLSNGGPTDVPGLANLEQRRAEFRELKKKLAEDNTIDNVPIAQVNDWVQSQRIAIETMVKEQLQLTRRVDPDGTYYFITNSSAADVDGWVSPARPFRAAARLDPMTGNYGRFPVRKDTHEIYLQLSSGESCIVRLTNAELVDNQLQAWPVWQPQGESASIGEHWDVAFVSGGPELPPAFECTELGSWTDSSEPAERFAGTAKYSTTFRLEAACEGARLLLGDVRESARVYLDGQFVRTLVAHPFQCDLPSLAAGQHTLEIEVTSLSANRIRDLDRNKVDWKKFYDINYVDINYKPFDASNWALRPSGLLGPVHLQPLKRRHDLQVAPNK